jgi:hypothetical protein
MDWSDWPTCPGCRERRSARCPVCGVSGTQFPLADIQETDAGERVLLLCEACDDHFLPQWHRFCPRCGHDFGDGIDVGRAAHWEAINPRTWIVLALLALGCLVVVAYFVWLFRK